MTKKEKLAQTTMMLMEFGDGKADGLEATVKWTWELVEEGEVDRAYGLIKLLYRMKAAGRTT